MLTDRERILTTIIDRLATTQSLGHGDGYHSASYAETLGGAPATFVHFAYDCEPRPGDLVMGKTSMGPSEWTIGWWVTSLPDIGGALVREIGSTRLCRYGNESFVPIRGLHPSDLLEGDEYQFSLKVRAAFRRGDTWTYRFGGLTFEGGPRDRFATIVVRQAFGGKTGKSQPFAVRMRWRKATSVAAILRALRDGGYGTRTFAVDTPTVEEATGG